MSRSSKRITAREIFHRVPAVKKPLWGGALWSTGDCISPVGRHGHEAALRQSVKRQGQAQTDKPLPRHDVQLQLFCGFGVLGLIPRSLLRGSSLCLESREPLTDIAIVNLAFATGADLRWIEIPTAVTDLIQSEDEFLCTSRRARTVGQSIRQILEPYHHVLDLTAYRTVTFVTKATPHGLITPPEVTVAHLLHIDELPRALTNMILCEELEETRTYTSISGGLIPRRLLRLLQGCYRRSYERVCAEESSCLGLDVSSGLSSQVSPRGL